MYGKIEKDELVKVYHQKPKWFYDDGTQVDDKYLASEGIYPIVDDRPQDFDELSYEVKKNTFDRLAVDHKRQVITNYYVYQRKPDEEIELRLYETKFMEIVGRESELLDKEIGSINELLYSLATGDEEKKNGFVKIYEASKKKKDDLTNIHADKEVRTADKIDLMKEFNTDIILEEEREKER